MKYMLNEIDMKIIKESLKAHLKQCIKIVKLDNEVKELTVLERCGLEEKIRIIKELLNNM